MVIALSILIIIHALIAIDQGAEIQTIISLVLCGIALGLRLI